MPLDDKSPCHPSDHRSCTLASISVRTSVHDRPASGCVRYDSSRSRMILRCQSGTGTCSGVAAMRSHRDCTKSIRSSTESSSNPGGGEGIGFGIQDPYYKRSISQLTGGENSGVDKEQARLTRVYRLGCGSFLMNTREGTVSARAKGQDHVVFSCIDGISGEAWQITRVIHPLQPQAERAGSHEAADLPD